ncbi:hypothetical protein ACFV4M_01905 [Kitasatospora indigofera]|uniref:hypothetical protein n=1 Tax=Kitasatospora indigofera TaxID=67307 RepID=UPI003667EC75
MMTQITEEQIARAEADAAAAISTRTDAEAALAEQPYSETRAKALTAAVQHAAHLTAYAGRLRSEWEERTAAAKEDRSVLEKAAAKQINQADKELKASKGSVVEAAAAAQQAVVRLMDAVVAHDALVRSHGPVLAGLGLTFNEGQPEYETGSSRSGVKVRGQWWTQVEAGVVAGWLLHRVAEARLPRMNALVGALRPCRKTVDGRPDGLFAGVESPAKVEFPRPPRVEFPRMESPVLGRAARR